MSSRLLPLCSPPTATRLSSSTGSATATDAQRPVGPYRRGDLTGLSGSYGRFGGSGPSHRLRDDPDVFGACSESWTRDEVRPKIQATIVRSQPNICVPQQADQLMQANGTASVPASGERDKCSAECRGLPGEMIPAKRAAGLNTRSLLPGIRAGGLAKGCTLKLSGLRPDLHTLQFPPGGGPGRSPRSPRLEGLTMRLLGLIIGALVILAGATSFAA